MTSPITTTTRSPRMDRGGACEEDAERDAETSATVDHNDAAAKPKPFNFKPPEGIEEFITWAFQQHVGTGSMVFHWKQWGDGIEKKSIPVRYTRSGLPPDGALLLAVQAVERELGFWKTGVYVAPKGPLGQFSFDNWGDIKIRDSARNKIVLTRRATKFLVTLKAKWTAENWQELEVEAEAWLESRSASPLRAVEHRRHRRRHTQRRVTANGNDRWKPDHVLGNTQHGLAQLASTGSMHGDQLAGLASSRGGHKLGQFNLSLDKLNLVPDLEGLEDILRGHSAFQTPPILRLSA
ncbi:hypothetical protein B0H16DRAFT_1450060 [Mycena metata]|uniref:Uncharacterized protein n=1 Tax=Mycena metata TaxID=1033252 RepID=A0AAD7K491_9AGAR|nr:hypothetical protein B0H16DRAFT_1450060 [Mycena metata]